MNNTELLQQITQGEREIVYAYGFCIGVGIKRCEGLHKMICNSILPESDAQYQHEKATIIAEMTAIAKAPELLKRNIELEEALKQIEQFSDCGSHELAIVRMKAIATNLLNSTNNGK